MTLAEALKEAERRESLHESAWIMRRPGPEYWVEGSWDGSRNMIAESRWDWTYRRSIRRWGICPKTEQPVIERWINEQEVQK